MLVGTRTQKSNVLAVYEPVLTEGIFWPCRNATYYSTAAGETSATSLDAAGASVPATLVLYSVASHDIPAVYARVRLLQLLSALSAVLFGWIADAKARGAVVRSYGQLGVLLAEEIPSVVKNWLESAR